MPPAETHAQLGKAALFEQVEPLSGRFRGFCPIAVGNDSGIYIEFAAEIDQFQEIVKIDKRLACGKTYAAYAGRSHVPDDLLGLGKLHFRIIGNIACRHAMGASDITAG